MILLLADKTDKTARRLGECLTSKSAVWRHVDPAVFPAGSTVDYAIENGRPPTIRLKTGTERVDLSTVKSIWYWHFGKPSGDGAIVDADIQRWVRREALSMLSGLWLSFEGFWLSHPKRIVEGQFKPYHLKIAGEVGFTIPKTLITNDPDSFLAFLQVSRGRVITKPVLHSNLEKGAHNYMIFTTEVTGRQAGFFRSIRLSPVIAQEYVDKNVEIRATVVGNLIFTAEIHSQESPVTKIDWRRYDFEHTPYEAHHLPDEVAKKCTELTRRLGLQYGAIDLILKPDGTYVFLEINPVGQFGWIEDITGLPITEAIADLLIKGKG